MLRPSNLPDYVDRGNEQVFRPPYQANRTGLSVILLSANKRQLDQIVQRELTDPTGRSWQFSAASSWLVFMVADIQRLQSVDPRDMQKGWVSEREVSVWLPLWDHRGHRAAWYLPYLFSNRAAAVLAGREVFGYPKAPASIHFEGNDPLCGFRVEVDAVESAGLEYKSRLALASKCNQSGTSEGGGPSAGHSETGSSKMKAVQNGRAAAVWRSMSRKGDRNWSWPQPVFLHPTYPDPLRGSRPACGGASIQSTRKRSSTVWRATLRSSF